jgi:hypothetical protein
MNFSKTENIYMNHASGDKDDHTATASLVLNDEPAYLVNADWILLASMIDRTNGLISCLSV